jgi:hypothetical protein
LFSLTIATGISFAEGERNIKVLVNDFYVMSDVSQFTESDRIFVPIRFVAEELGYIVEWNGEKQEVNMTKEDKVVKLTIGSKNVFVNGEENLLEVPAKLKQSRTFVEYKAISHLFGESVGYNPDVDDEFIGSWSGQTMTIGTDDYYEKNFVVERIRTNEYLFKSTSIKENGSELKVESYAFYNPLTKTMKLNESHVTTSATGDFNSKWFGNEWSFELKELNYFEKTDDAKVFMKKD